MRYGPKGLHYIKHKKPQAYYKRWRPSRTHVSQLRQHISIVAWRASHLKPLPPTTSKVCCDQPQRDPSDRDRTSPLSAARRCREPSSPDNYPLSPHALERMLPLSANACQYPDLVGPVWQQSSRSDCTLHTVLEHHCPTHKLRTQPLLTSPFFFLKLSILRSVGQPFHRARKSSNSPRWAPKLQ